MPNWRVEVEIPIDVDPDNLAAYAEDVDTLAYNDVEKVLRLSTWLDAADFDTAATGARVWVVGLRAAQEATPQRLTVESEAARRTTWALGSKEFAQLLGVSTARLRQLQEKPDFPQPIPGVDSAGGRVWRADDAATYKRTRVPGAPGRPPAAQPDA